MKSNQYIISTPPSSPTSPYSASASSSVAIPVSPSVESNSDDYDYQIELNIVNKNAIQITIGDRYDIEYFDKDISKKHKLTEYLKSVLKKRGVNIYEKYYQFMFMDKWITF